MAETAGTLVATLENFASAVVEASGHQPVLVDFWAPWCGPCLALMPVLDKVALDYAGRFVLAKVNVDEQQDIAGHFGVRSIPTLLLFHRGQVAEQVTGIQPEAAIRAMLDRYVAPLAAGSGDSDDPILQAHAHVRAGDHAAAAGIIENALVDRPDDPQLLATLAGLQLSGRNAEAARATLTRIGARDPQYPALVTLRARLGFVEAAAESADVASARASVEANPADSGARHALAAHHALAGDFGTALAEWLELMRRDRGFGHDAARRSMLAVFELLGNTDELVAAYRRRMASLLH
jgi:putative thioredoxin